MAKKKGQETRKKGLSESTSKRKIGGRMIRKTRGKEEGKKKGDGGECRSMHRLRVGEGG